MAQNSKSTMHIYQFQNTQFSIPLEGYEHSGCANSSPNPLLLPREGGLSADDTHVLLLREGAGG